MQARLAYGALDAVAGGVAYAASTERPKEVLYLVSGGVSHSGWELGFGVWVLTLRLSGPPDLVMVQTREEGAGLKSRAGVVESQGSRLEVRVKEAFTVKAHEFR